MTQSLKKLYSKLKKMELNQAKKEGAKFVKENNYFFYHNGGFNAKQHNLIMKINHYLDGHKTGINGEKI